MSELAEIYQNYIACLNAQDWQSLSKHVAPNACHNGRRFGLAGYRAMLEQNFADIPDLSFEIAMLVCEAPVVASRLYFDCHPKGQFLGLAVNGRRVVFTENVIYRFDEGRISEVWSIVDKAAIEEQL